MQFGSAETKLKLLHIKLKEAEMAQAKMKQESESLRRNLNMLSNIVPEEMAKKIKEFLIKMAGDAMDNMDEHLKLRQKHNMASIASVDQSDRFQKNLRGCLNLIQCGNEYDRFMQMREKNRLLQS